MARKTDLEKFQSKYVIDDNTGCWNWIASKVRGYGAFRYNSKTIGAHVFSHITFNTTDPLHNKPGIKVK